MNPVIGAISVALFASSVLGVEYYDNCCPDPDDLPYGYISHGQRSRYEVDSVVVYACKPGYKLWGDSKIRCLRKGSYGYWDRQPPKCKKICKLKWSLCCCGSNLIQ